MSPDLERLIRLQKLDLDAEARRRTLAELPAALQALDERINTRQQTLDAGKARLVENQAARRALDKDLAVVQGRLTKFKDQLMEVKTNKEYLAMQHEISMAQEGVRTFEDKILEIMVGADDLDGEIKAAEKALAEEKVKVNEERTARQKQATTMEAEIAELTTARAKVVGELTREAVALFEHVSRARKGHAMAEARDRHVPPVTCGCGPRSSTTSAAAIDSSSAKAARASSTSFPPNPHHRNRNKPPHQRDRALTRASVSLAGAANHSQEAAGARSFRTVGIEVREVRHRAEPREMNVRGIQAGGDQLIAVGRPTIESQTIAPLRIRREPRIRVKRCDGRRAGW